MKDRSKGFLTYDDNDSEMFDYVTELHLYLWEFVRCVNPGAGGHLSDYVDDALAELKNTIREKRSVK